MMNLSASIKFHATRTPGATALIYEGAHISYAELWQRVQALAAWLAGRGIGEGDVVAVFMKNSPAFIETAIATSHIGGVFLPVNYRLARDEVAYILENSEAKLLLADDEFEPVVGGLPGLVLLDKAGQKDVRSFAGSPERAVPACYRRPDDLFRLMYTSGTTDRPKGVMHSYSNVYWKNIDHVIFLGLTASDRILVVGPLYHVGAFDLPGIALLWIGGTMCILREFDEEAAFTAIERERLTCAWFAPVMLGRLLAYPHRDRFDRSSLKWAIGGGEKTPEARIRAFTELFPNGRYIDGYGLTETCSGDTLMEAGKEIEKIGSTGRALAHCEVDIRDDAGNSLPPGEQGEICVRGPKVTAGYWKDPEKTRNSFFPDGWFRTGDIGFLDSEGFLTITDRKKDMILSGGENIASSEVERVIYTMPQVSEVAVIGLPDPQWGERPVAIVVPKPGQTLDYETLRAHCRKHLAGFKVPRELVLRDSLPRNPSGKILKRTLREELAKSGSA
ncbi:MAG: AMP-binding protein [Rhodospirillales bacterium]|nr:AMP-binding protein [Rhodospirillales bacterium]